MFSLLFALDLCLSGFQSSLLLIYQKAVTGRIAVHTAQHKTCPAICNAHFQDRRGGASLCYRNRAEITVLV